MPIQFMGGMNENGDMAGGALFVDTSTGHAAEGYDEYFAAVGVAPAAPRLAAPVQPIQAKAVQAVAAVDTIKLCKAETFNVISLARKRLKFLKSEIKKLRAFEKEELELTRLLDASAKPLALVHPISRKSKDNK